ncbi:uncharacterized protein LOC132047592 [Lycium ferocissimum]|uniref:uncharacterized protein LOC132047592 n=1 Tax=Lycium ferocissimum TaxID=112874 RepID=UPI002815A5CA|nr:uncharacterized protein LOC132047592 [Lycium ferocissimum]
MGSSAHTLPAINKLIMNKGPSLSQQQRSDLCTIVTEQEIYTVLMAIGYDKAPGLDEYNVVFFKKSWALIKQDVIKAVQEFFVTGNMYKTINHAIITRLQKVIASVISEAQVGFIPGRRISDNIMLAHELVKGYTRKNISLRCMIKTDLQKAYDLEECIYLQQVMEEMKFPGKFVA